MLVQVGLQRKRSVAALAAEVLHSAMSLYVRPQVRSVCERLPAEATLERLLAGV